jgi:hypothetical protein
VLDAGAEAKGGANGGVRDPLFSGDADDWADVRESFGRGQMANDAPDGALLW